MRPSRRHRLAARHARRAHGLAAVFWLAMIPVSLVTGLKNSVPFLVGISVYALMGAHLSGWAAEAAAIAAESHHD